METLGKIGVHQPLLTTSYDDLHTISEHHYGSYIVLAQNDMNFMTFFTKLDLKLEKLNKSRVSVNLDP